MSAEVRKNAGYTITDSVHVGEAEFVIGERDTKAAPFVTWECTDGSNYFWGHYLENRLDAVADLMERVGQELTFQKQLQARAAKPPKETERDR